MIVYYKISSAESVNPSPLFLTAKDKLASLCLDSFIEAYRTVRPHVVFVCDNASEDLIKKADSIPFPHTIHKTQLGNFMASVYQYELAYKQDDDILFQEDDYLYIPDTGEAFVIGLQTLGLVSPYDHLNFYKDTDMHSLTVDLRLVNNTHWRTTERNTMTFAIKNDIFKRNYEVFKKYGNWDSDVWREIDAQLWTPIPSMATHMVKDWLAPSIQWQELWKTRI